MDAGFTLDFKGSYIHVIHSADYRITPDTQKQFWETLREACSRYDCWRVLAEAPAPPQRDMSLLDAFRSAEQATEVAPVLALACVFKGYQPDDTTEFFKTVAYNRGIRVEFFVDRDEALRWLGVEMV